MTWFDACEGLQTARWINNLSCEMNLIYWFYNNGCHTMTNRWRKNRCSATASTPFRTSYWIWIPGVRQRQKGIPVLDDYGDRRVVHSIRHSCISEMISKTSNHVLVQQIVGHEHSQSLGITARYTHRVPLSDLINVIDNLKWLYCLRWLAFRHACCLYPNRALWLLLPEIW